MKIRLVILSAFILSAFWMEAVMHANDAEGTLKIKGTSSLHDWESDVEDFEVDASLDLEKEEGYVNVTVVAESIKSGKSIMDGKTYDALRTEDYPKISFVSNSIDVNGNKLVAQGDLTIGGVSRPAEVKAEYQKSGNNISVEGSYSLKMTEFNIDPPTAMFGTLETGNEVTVVFNMNFNQY